MSDPIFNSPVTNPFGLTDVGTYATLTLTDIDGDGDLDAFVGNQEGNTLFYLNTGTASSAAFAALGTNLFGLTDIGFSACPTFADIDSDGDLDAFVGDLFGNTWLYRNTGTASYAAFATRVANPFGLTNVGTAARPTFVDIDGNGNLDAFVSNFNGNTLFYLNTQPSNTTPTLTSSTPADNATAVVVGNDLTLTFSEAVQADTGNIVISNGTDIRNISVTDSQVTISGNTVTINPTADLNAGSNYNVQMSSGVIKDLAGNAFAGINDATTLDFITVNAPPTGSVYINGTPEQNQTLTATTI